MRQADRWRQRRAPSPSSRFHACTQSECIRPNRGMSEAARRTRIAIRRLVGGAMSARRREVCPRPSVDAMAIESASLSPEPRAYRAQRPLAFRQMKRPRLEWGEKTEGMLRNLLKQAQRDLGAGMILVNETQSSLERWWNIIRREESEKREAGTPTNREAEDLRERLAALLRELEVVANRVKDELGDVSSAAAGMFPPAAVAASLSLDALLEDDPIGPRQERRPPSDREMWMDAFDLEAGPWALHLAGAALPKPQLTVSVRGNEVGEPPAAPFLALVRPVEGFETVNLDSSGSGKIALPAGESVMLLQAAASWCDPAGVSPAQVRVSVRLVSSCHGDVLRPCGFDRHCSKARCRRVARSGWRVSRCRLCGSDGDGRESRQEAR
jgi:hypothetical protein